ncbi:hypothetical protein D4764_22G0006850 [Takifugu flavidus]|uniref:Uncharacterized protein n=1 Tax=Takifugu flavidus TaxID=433684 RepID=A0A5C6NDM9_9TELE|nr:hypothetical protein D4764_22G0006850 [Takifugu flavidus]
MAANANLTGLRRRHRVKVGAGSVLSVEKVALAVGQEIGHGSVKSAARMNRAVVLFVEQVEQANRLVETGITVGGQFVQVTPLTQPAARITLSNVPPFISDEFLAKELSRHGKLGLSEPRRSGGEEAVRCAEGDLAAPDGAEMESKAEGKRSECVRVTEVSGARENVEMVVEVTGESGEAGKEMDPTGVAFEVLGGLGETGDGMSEISELGEVGEMGDMGETGEQGVAVGDVGQETGKMAGELGVGGMSTAPPKRRRKQKNVMNDGGDRKAGRLEDAAAATDNSDQEYMSDASELSNTVADSERDDLYPPSMIKNFLTKTKGMRGPDLGSYFPDKLLFIQSAGHWIKHRVVSDLTDPEIFRLKKHMGKARRQLREQSNESTSL